MSSALVRNYLVNSIDGCTWFTCLILFYMYFNWYISFLLHASHKYNIVLVFELIYSGPVSELAVLILTMLSDYWISLKTSKTPHARMRFIKIVVKITVKRLHSISNVFLSMEIQPTYREGIVEGSRRLRQYNYVKYSRHMLDILQKRQ